MTSRRVLLKVLVSGGLAALAPQALASDGAPLQADEAPAEVKVEILILHATNEGKGIDKNLGDLPELKKPPFSSYDTYRQLTKSTAALTKQKESESKLPNDGKLLLTYKGMSADKKAKSRFLLGVKITKPDGKELLTFTATSPKKQFFFAAGPEFKGGILVIGIKVL